MKSILILTIFCMACSKEFVSVDRPALTKEIVSLKNVDGLLNGVPLSAKTKMAIDSLNEKQK